MLSGIYGLIDIFFAANFCVERRYGSESKHMINSHIVTIDDKPVTAYNGVEIKPTIGINEIDTPDLIIVCSSAEIVVECCENNVLVDQQDKVINWLKGCHSRGTTLASYCTGAFIVAATGLLNGKTATTHWRNFDLFRKVFPFVKLDNEQLIVDHGDIVCSGGALSYVDMALFMINRFIGPDISAECAKLIVFDPIREKQSPYVSFYQQKDHNDQAILQAQEFIESHYKRDISMDSLAEKVGLGSRTFKRRFKQATSENPLNYLQRIRVEQAKRKLEKTTEPINNIIWSVGYEDISSFRQLFKRFTGLTPKDYRQKFALQSAS